jgi:hypothetical protein
MATAVLVSTGFAIGETGMAPLGGKKFPSPGESAVPVLLQAAKTRQKSK